MVARARLDDEGNPRKKKRDGVRNSLYLTDAWHRQLKAGQWQGLSGKNSREPLLKTSNRTKTALLRFFTNRRSRTTGRGLTFLETFISRITQTLGRSGNEKLTKRRMQKDRKMKTANAEQTSARAFPAQVKTLANATERAVWAQPEKKARDSSFASGAASPCEAKSKKLDGQNCRRGQRSATYRARNEKIPKFFHWKWADVPKPVSPQNLNCGLILLADVWFAGCR